jgi:N-methylhydantoinase B
MTGGSGARSGADGLDAVDNSVTNGMNYPAEVLEQEHPVLVRRHELREGSAGAGRYRGGRGLRRVVELLEDGVLSVRGHRHLWGPAGIFGGAPGAPTEFWLRRGDEIFPVPMQASGMPTSKGDVFIGETPGGGGLGEPRERDHEAIRDDVGAGVETPAEALRNYEVEVELERSER